ncbi:MAG: aldo/keto reductase [Candidatus Zixiibacteriota bacterium]|nr:MAG: aldo/keto reductase [candidate division Zixibacteria bacterium]
MSGKGSDYTRRSFISTAATGLVSAGLVNFTPGKVFAQETETPEGTKEKKLIYRTIGRTGLKVPIVSMGVMNSNNPEIVQASYEEGIRHFDTAAYYQFGRNEQMVGSVINKLKVRDKVVIGTKNFIPQQRRGLTPEQSKTKLIEACEASLSRLGTDYVDIMYIHDVRDAETVADQGIIEGLKTLKQQGKVRSTGLATHAAMADVINAAVSGGFYDVVLTAINFTMADDAGLLEAIKNAAANGVGIVAMKALAGGARWPNPQSRRDYTSSTIATAALKWVLRNESISTSIPGYTNYEHMREDFSVAYNLEYTEQEKKLLSDNNIKLSMGYCRQCNKCLATCPDGVDVPTLMRVHMYAAQYANFKIARGTLDGIPARSSINVCRDCLECGAQCANTVDIARRIDELKAMYC